MNLTDSFYLTDLLYGDTNKQQLLYLLTEELLYNIDFFLHLEKYSTQSECFTTDYTQI